MTNRIARNLAWIAALVLVTAVTGCAKKQAPAPPAPPHVAEAPPTPAPTPVTAPAPTPPPTPVIGSGDFLPAFFDFDAYALRDDARAALDRDAKLLRDNGTIGITIEGHCDERGTVEYNQSLGERRAQAARDYLVAAGIAATRLQIVSYGKERPFCSGHDEVSWQHNRRAHIVVR